MTNASVLRCWVLDPKVLGSFPFGIGIPGGRAFMGKMLTCGRILQQYYWSFLLNVTVFLGFPRSNYTNLFSNIPNSKVT